MKFPATLGEVADKIYETQKERLKMQADVDAKAKEESELKKHAKKLLIASKQKSASGAFANVTLVPKTISTIDEERGGWEALQEYIKENDAFDLLYRRVNDKAYIARLENKIVVPGLKPENVINLSVTKAGRKGRTLYGESSEGKGSTEGSTKGSPRRVKQGEAVRTRKGRAVQQRRDDAAQRPHQKGADKRRRAR